MSSRAAPLLVTGLPRSGSSWVAGVLSAHAPDGYVHEPDNEYLDAYAARAKRQLGRFPVLATDARAPAAYEALWRDLATGRARTGGSAQRTLARRMLGDVSLEPPRIPEDAVARWRRSAALRLAAPPRRGEVVLVKTVFVPLALGWLAPRWPGPVVVVSRDLRNVIASWRSRDWGPELPRQPGFQPYSRGLRALAGAVDLDQLPPPPSETASALERTTWELAVMHTAQLAAAAAHPRVHVIHHDVLCADPSATFRTLAVDLGVPWTSAGEDYLREHGVPGTGTYDVRRVAGEEIGKWRTSLSAGEQAIVHSMLEGFADIGAPS